MSSCVRVCVVHRRIYKVRIKLLLQALILDSVKENKWLQVFHMYSIYIKCSNPNHQPLPHRQTVSRMFEINSYRSFAQRKPSFFYPDCLWFAAVGYLVSTPSVTFHAECLCLTGPSCKYHRHSRDWHYTSPSVLLRLLSPLCMMTSKEGALCQDQTSQEISEAKEEVFWCIYWQELTRAYGGYQFRGFWSQPVSGTLVSSAWQVYGKINIFTWTQL